MNRLREYKKLEKSLDKKFFKDAEDNEVSLSKEDFKYGKLTMLGYHRLKQQCEYISFREEIEIKVPEEYGVGFKKNLQYLGASELRHLKKDRIESLVSAIVLSAIGIFFILLRLILGAQEWFKDSADIIGELVVIASWVFLWAATEKWFFERRKLRIKQMGLLQLLSAKITIVKD